MSTTDTFPPLKPKVLDALRFDPELPEHRFEESGVFAKVNRRNRVRLYFVRTVGKARRTDGLGLYRGPTHHDGLPLPELLRELAKLRGADAENSGRERDDYVPTLYEVMVCRDPNDKARVAPSRFVEWRERQLDEKRRALAVNWLEQVRYMETMFAPLMKRRMNTINDVHILDCIAQYKRTGMRGTPAPKAAENVWRGAKQIFRYASLEGWMKPIAFAGIVAPQTSEELRFLMPIELQGILRALTQIRRKRSNGDGRRIELFYRWILLTRCRPIQLERLQWRELSKGSEYWSWYIPKEKNTKGRGKAIDLLIPLPYGVAAIIEELQKEHDGDDDALVFGSMSGVSHITAELQEASGTKEWAPYALRRTGATFALARGEDDRVVDWSLGHQHQGPSGTFRRYAIVAPEKKERYHWQSLERANRLYDLIEAGAIDDDLRELCRDLRDAKETKEMLHKFKLGRDVLEYPGT